MKQEISVGSITYALKGKEILGKQGIHANIERKNRLTSKNGCGYKLVFSGDREAAISVLKRYNVKLAEDRGD